MDEAATLTERRLYEAAIGALCIHQVAASEVAPDGPGLLAPAPGTMPSFCGPAGSTVLLLTEGGRRDGMSLPRFVYKKTGTAFFLRPALLLGCSEEPPMENAHTAGNRGRPPARTE